MTVFKNMLKNSIWAHLQRRKIAYIQGQSPSKNIREYFYYIDHQGQLFLDDSKMKNFTSCFKEKDFLEFFFKRLKVNETGRYVPEFPYFSPCGRERNYVRCDDLPIVFTHIVQSVDSSKPDVLSYNWAGPLLVFPFQPEHICMLPKSGRIYHPAPEKVGQVGLIKSSLAIELSRNFHFSDDGDDAPPTHLTWKGEKYVLSNQIVNLLNSETAEE